MSKNRLCIVLVFGPAGSGKTTFTWKFSDWTRNINEYNIAPVNLDPAALKIPYKPIFDIRNYVTAKEMMIKYNLGPNGAIIKAVEESEKYLNNLFRSINNSYDYILIDTPGIMEVFVGREVGRIIIDNLLKRYVVIGLFIMDASIINKVSEYIYFKSLYVLSGLKLGIPSIPVWNKISNATKLFMDIDDLTTEELINKLYLEPGLYTDAAKGLLEITSSLESAVRFLKIDSLNYKGFEDVMSILHEVYCACGDLT